MSTNLSELLPLWAPTLITCLIIVLLLGIRRRMRARNQNRYGDVDGASIGIVVGSLLGLLGFLLAFTFGMAGSRFEDRRQTVLAESNIIGTAYLRTDLLSQQQGDEAKRLIQKYVEIRAGVGSPTMTSDALTQVIVQSVAIQHELWQVAINTAKGNPSPITGLFIQATNDLIDIHSKRVMLGMQSTIPIEIWICLYVVALIALGSAGFQWTSSEGQSVYPFIALVVAFAAVLTLVADLDNPEQGFIRTDQTPMLDLAKSLKAVPEQG